MVTPTNLRRFTVTETREAVEVTAENLDEVAAWCGGEVLDINGPCVRYSSGQDGLGFAIPGSVLVKYPHGYTVRSQREFERDSERWTEET